MELKISQHSIIMADMTEATYVSYGVQELHSFLGLERSIIPFWEPKIEEQTDLIIIIGRRIATQAGINNTKWVENQGSEGYVIFIEKWNGIHLIVVVGNDPQGTKFGLLDLIRNFSLSNSGISLPVDFTRREKPHFKIRAMYAHLHWQYNRPYACRSWSLKDWENYVDLLSHWGCNVLQIWPMLCLLPDPLSDKDQEYLSRFASLTEYANNCRGMEVWVGECCNNVAHTDWGVPIERREYFGTEKLLNPGDPKQFEQIMNSRRNLYRSIPNASGYWIIDSDPGFWKGSPSTDFVDVFAGNQKIMKVYNRTDAQMIYWMLWGWGNGTREENWEQVLSGLTERLGNSWYLLLGTYKEQMEVVRKLGLTNPLIYFPYGTIEQEPGTPQTQFHFEQIKDNVDYAVNNGFEGYMGQVQTSVVQLPNLYFLMRCLWNPETRFVSPEKILNELAHHIFPEISSLISGTWMAMKNGDLAEMGFYSEKLEQLLTETNRIEGAFGKLLFGNSGLIVEDLFLMLNIRLHGELFNISTRKNQPLEEIRTCFYYYVRNTLMWQARHKYFAMGGMKYLYNDYLESGVTGWYQYIQHYGLLDAKFDLLWPVKSRLVQEEEFHPALIDGVLEELISQPNPLKT
jgi:hypothetical protein